MKTHIITGIPVKILNITSLTQAKLVFLPGQTLTVDVTIRGTEADLLTIDKGDFVATADLSKYVFRKGQVPIPVEITKQPNNVSILNNLTLTVNGKFDELVQKTFHIVPRTTSKVNGGYIAQNAVCKPAEVIVSGAAQYIEGISNVVANYDAKNAIIDVNTVSTLQALNSADVPYKDTEVTIEPTTAEVMVPVKKIKTVNVNIKTKGSIGKDMVLKSLLPTNDKVDIAGSTDALNSITGLDTEPIDLSAITNGKAVNAKLILPNGITIVSGDGTVTVNAVVSKIIQKNLNLSIALLNLSTGLTATFDPPGSTPPKEIMVVTGDANIINGLKDGDISCYVDLTNLVATPTPIELPVKFTLPDGVSTFSISITTVKVNIVTTVTG
ncbi:MAG TPA: CdaR family protein [Clostridiaceae bacterium]